MVSATVGLVHCDCPKWHSGPVSIRTRSRHREQAGMIDPPVEDPSRPQITATTIPEEADHDHAPPVHDFDPWSMDIDGEGDGGFLSDRRTSEDEGDSNETDEEDLEDLLQLLTIDSGV
jgi:hypothetical protein